MATLTEHRDRIRAAIDAAVSDGYRVEFDIEWQGFESSDIEYIDLDILNPRATEWQNVYRGDRS